jgi:hypothetical protein
MSSRLALSEISHAFSLPNLEGLLSATNSHITGFVAALTFASKGFILPHSQEFLQIVAPSKDQCLIVIGYLMANGYEINTMPLSAEVGVPWPSTAPIAYRVSEKATYVVIKTSAQVETSAVAAENFCLPSYSDELLLTRSMTWLTKPESALTEDDQYLIDKYNDAGFVIFAQEPKQLTIPSRQVPLALSTVLPAEHPLRMRRHLNSLSPHYSLEQGITGDHESAFSTMLAAGAAGIPLPVPTASIRRQKAAPSTSDDSTPSDAHRGRTRTDSELSDYHDCTPPDSIPRIFFPRDSHFSVSDTE